MERHDERTWFDPRTGDQVSLTYIGLVPDIPAPLADLPLLRRKLAEETAETGSIIEAHVVALDGVPTLFQLIKLPIPGQDTGLAFIAAFTVPRAHCSVVLRIQCAEEHTTGVRESTVAAQVGFEQCFPPHPYAPDVHGQLPYSLADEAAWDRQFPDHPLTRARAWAHKTIATARVDPRFAALPPFQFAVPAPPAPLPLAPQPDPAAPPPAPPPQPVQPVSSAPAEPPAAPVPPVPSSPFDEEPAFRPAPAFLTDSTVEESSDFQPERLFQPEPGQGRHAEPSGSAFQPEQAPPAAGSGRRHRPDPEPRPDGEPVPFGVSVDPDSTFHPDQFFQPERQPEPAPPPSFPPEPASQPSQGRLAEPPAQPASQPDAPLRTGRRFRPEPEPPFEPAPQATSDPVPFGVPIDPDSTFHPNQFFQPEPEPAVQPPAAAPTDPPFRTEPRFRPKIVPPPEEAPRFQEPPADAPHRSDPGFRPEQYFQPEPPRSEHPRHAEPPIQPEAAPQPGQFFQPEPAPHERARHAEQPIEPEPLSQPEPAPRSEQARHAGPPTRSEQPFQSAPQPHPEHTQPPNQPDSPFRQEAAPQQEQAREPEPQPEHPAQSGSPGQPEQFFQPEPAPHERARHAEPSIQSEQPFQPAPPTEPRPAQFFQPKQPEHTHHPEPELLSQPEPEHARHAGPPIQPEQRQPEPEHADQSEPPTQLGQPLRPEHTRQSEPPLQPESQTDHTSQAEQPFQPEPDPVHQPESPVQAEDAPGEQTPRSLFEPAEEARPPAEPGDVLQTVLVGLPLAGYLPLWLEGGVTFWRMKDPEAVRARLGAGLETRSEIDTRRYREAAMFSRSRGTLFMMDRVRDDTGHLGGTSTQLEPATEEEAYAAVDDRAVSELYVWLGEVVLASVRRGEFVAVESGGWTVPMRPVVLIMLRTDGRSWHSVVETSPVPEGAPVWRDQQPVDGDTQVLASPATDQTIRASGLLTRFAVATWGMHPFRLGLSFGPNPTL
jgi:hypothetical protein